MKLTRRVTESNTKRGTLEVEKHQAVVAVVEKNPACDFSKRVSVESEESVFDWFCLRHTVKKNLPHVMSERAPIPRPDL